MIDVDLTEYRTMKTFAKLALVAAIGFAGAAAATDFSFPDANDIPTDQVQTFYSNAGEGMDAFVKRIAPQFSAYTEKTGHEACGTLAAEVAGNDGTKPGAMSIMMGTLNSQIACKNNAVAPGYISIVKTVHSHPQRAHVRLTALDMKIRGTPGGFLRVEDLDICHFSPQDYSTSGFLIACGKVLYQTGRGTEHSI